MAAPPDLDIKSLAARAGVTPRTVHYYIQQGLLPPAGTQGPAARYGRGHLARLRLIKRLQREHLPLVEIARRLKGLSDRQVAALLDDDEQRRSAQGGSALEYIRSVLGEAEPTPGGEPLRLATAKAPALRSVEAEQSLWDRFLLADGVELHVRRPLSRSEQKQLEELLAAARRILANRP